MHTLAKIQKMRAGHLATRDALAIAQTVTGAVWYFVFLEHVSDAGGAATDEARSGTSSRGGALRT